MASMPVYGQPDTDLWSPKPLQTEQEESLQRPHGGWLCLPSGLLPRHEVSPYFVPSFSDKGQHYTAEIVTANKLFIIAYQF